MTSQDLSFQDLSSVQGALGKKPVTIASTTTIAPTTFLSMISGTTAIATVTPPISGAHSLAFVFTAATPVAFTTTGNIANVATPTQNVPVFLIYDPLTTKYYVK